MTAKIIGLTGKAQSGKDTVAKIIIEHLGKLNAIRIAFADEVKRICAAGLGIDIKQLEAKKQEPKIRRLLQRVGTDVFREYDEHVWINRGFEKIRMLKNYNNGILFIITDVRFLNEAEAIHKEGGLIWRISRNHQKQNKRIALHKSETEMDQIEPDYTLNNDGTVDELKEQVLSLLSSI